MCVRCGKQQPTKCQANYLLCVSANIVWNWISETWYMRRRAWHRNIQPTHKKWLKLAIMNTSNSTILLINIPTFIFYIFFIMFFFLSFRQKINVVHIFWGHFPLKFILITQKTLLLCSHVYPSNTHTHTYIFIHLKLYRSRMNWTKSYGGRHCIYRLWKINCG